MVTKEEGSRDEEEEVDKSKRRKSSLLLQLTDDQQFTRRRISPRIASPKRFSLFLAKMGDKMADLESGEAKRGGSSKVAPEEASSSTQSTCTDSAPAPSMPARASYPQPRISVDLSSTLNQHALPATLRGDESDDGDGGLGGDQTTTKAKKPIRKLKAFRRHLLHPRTKRQKAVCGVFWIVLVAAAVCFLIWGLPPLTKKVLVPILERVKKKMSRPAITGAFSSSPPFFFSFHFEKKLLHFIFFSFSHFCLKKNKTSSPSRPRLSLSLSLNLHPSYSLSRCLFPNRLKSITAMCFFAIVLLPMLFIPFRPFIWVLSYAVGPGHAFGFVTAATAVGMSLQFLLSKTLLREKAAKWSQQATWSATLMETVKEAGPFKTVLILRLGPVPYSLLSYCLVLSPDITYLKYIVASVIGHAADNAMHVFLGASFEGIGSIVKGEKPTPQRIASVAVPLIAAIAVCVGGTIYGKRAYAKVRAARAEHAAEEVLSGGGEGSSSAAAGAAGASAIAPAAATVIAAAAPPPAAARTNGISRPAHTSEDVEMAINLAIKK